MKVATTTSGAENRAIEPDPDRQIRFTDWNDGQAVAHKPENRRDDILLERPTMTMGNMTTFYPGEGEPPSSSVKVSGKSLYERLDDHNRDCWWKYRDDVEILRGVDRESKRHLICVFAGEVAMNDYLRQRAFRKLLELDLPSFGLPVELVAFVLCTLVSNSEAEANGGEKLYHPQRSASNNDPHFHRLAENLISAFPRITNRSITSMFNKLTQGRPRLAVLKQTILSSAGGRSVRRPRLTLRKRSTHPRERSNTEGDPLYKGSNTIVGEGGWENCNL